MNFNIFIQVVSAMIILTAIPTQTAQSSNSNHLSIQGSTTQKVNTTKYNSTPGFKTLIFHRDNETYFMTGNRASGNKSERSHYDIEIIGEHIIIIPPKSSNNYITSTYLRSNGNGELEAWDFMETSSFELIPVSNKNNRFHLSQNRSIFVTPSSRPPFSFYKQEFYPNETPAEFSVEAYEFDIEESYGGQRENIARTAKLIHESNPNQMNKTMAYKELVQLMTKYKHIQGKEIFALWQYMLDDLGVNALLFRQLPLTVQILLLSEPVTLLYKQTDTNLTFPMKYHWASDHHEDILPYSFHFNKSSQLWAITYADSHQLTSLGRSLTQVLSINKHFIFEIYLTSDLNSIQIDMCVYDSCSEYRSRRYITTNTRISDFYFSAQYYNSHIATFIIRNEE